jgi:hypothetical protein
MSDNLLLDLTPSEVTLIRSALRTEQDRHKRSNFVALEVSVQDLRNKISDAMIDHANLNHKASV